MSDELFFRVSQDPENPSFLGASVSMSTLMPFLIDATSILDNRRFRYQRQIEIDYQIIVVIRPTWALISTLKTTLFDMWTKKYLTVEGRGPIRGCLAGRGPIRGNGAVVTSTRPLFSPAGSQGSR